LRDPAVAAGPGGTGKQIHAFGFRFGHVDFGHDAISKLFRGTRKKSVFLPKRFTVADFLN
jgi:hypothetical protein